MILAYLIPYMLFSIRIYIHIWLSTSVARLYASMISCGMIFNGMRINYESGKILFKFFLISANRYLAPVVDTTLLNPHFSFVADAVGALIFTVNSKTFTPTFNLVLSFSSFSGFNYHAICHM